MDLTELQKHCKVMHQVNPNTGLSAIETEFKAITAYEPSGNVRTDSAQLQVRDGVDVRLLITHFTWGRGL